MDKANQDIRQMMKDYEIKQWEVANLLGISEATLTRWLRIEMSQIKKNRIKKAILNARQDLEQ